MQRQGVALVGCSARTHSSLRGSVSVCSIRCVLATKFGGEARIHVFSKTQKSFLEIPLRDDIIKIINLFLWCLSLNSGKLIN